MKGELAGLADIAEEVVRERDSHMPIRNPEHRSFRNLLWSLSQPQQAVCVQLPSLPGGGGTQRKELLLSDSLVAACLCEGQGPAA